MRSHIRRSKQAHHVKEALTSGSCAGERCGKLTQMSEELSQKKVNLVPGLCQALWHLLDANPLFCSITSTLSCRVS